MDLGMPLPELKRDHLFISYATEDSHLAEWLTLKLTSEGYIVWCDRFKLLGGESYPQDIDEAIKKRTFRFIALLSSHSTSKDNPVKERTLAINLAKERGESDFLIPLNVDGLKPTELDWMVSNLTHISFQDWAKGLKQLLKKLDSISTPKPIVLEGKNIAVQTFLNSIPDNIESISERLHSNIFQFTKIPEVIYKVKLSQPYQYFELKYLLNSWPHYYVNQLTLFSFQYPTTYIREELPITKIEQVNWKENSVIEEIPTSDIIKNLLFTSLESRGVELGLKREQKKRLYFPKGLLENNNILYKDYSGKRTFTASVGFRNRTHPGREYDYHLSPRFDIKEREDGKYFLQLGVQVYITDKDGVPVRGTTILRRRKHLCKNWWNSQWLSKHQAIASFLSEDSDEIICGQESSTQIKISTKSLKFESPKKITKDSEKDGFLEEETNG